MAASARLASQSATVTHTGDTPGSPSGWDQRARLLIVRFTDFSKAVGIREAIVQECTEVHRTASISSQRDSSAASSPFC